MLGSFRLLLAVMVVYTHLGAYHGAVLGHHAVFGFYCVSGFLITRVLNERYRFSFVPFAANRFLRLYPMYLAVALLTIPALYLLESPGSFNGRYNLPSSWWPWVQSFLIVPTYHLPPFRLVPVSWSIALEIINYALLWAVVGRRPSFAWAALAFGIAIHAVSLWNGEPPNSRYLPIQATVLPFALGALVYFYREWLASAVKWPVVIVWAGIAVVGHLHGTMNTAFAEGLFYAGTLTLAASIVLLDSQRSGPLDKFLGDLAYPVFLSHILVGLLASRAFGLFGRTDALFAVALPLMLVLSAVLVVAQNRLIEPMRDQVRAPQPKLSPAE